MSVCLRKCKKQRVVVLPLDAWTSTATPSERTITMVASPFESPHYLRFNNTSDTIRENHHLLNTHHRPVPVELEGTSTKCERWRCSPGSLLRIGNYWLSHPPEKEGAAQGLDEKKLSLLKDSNGQKRGNCWFKLHDTTEKSCRARWGKMAVVGDMGHSRFLCFQLLAATDKDTDFPAK